MLEDGAAGQAAVVERYLEPRLSGGCISARKSLSGVVWLEVRRHDSVAGAPAASIFRALKRVNAVRLSAFRSARKAQPQRVLTAGFKGKPGRSVHSQHLRCCLRRQDGPLRAQRQRRRVDAQTACVEDERLETRRRLQPDVHDPSIAKQGGPARYRCRSYSSGRSTSGARARCRRKLREPASGRRRFQRAHPWLPIGAVPFSLIVVAGSGRHDDASVLYDLWYVFWVCVTRHVTLENDSADFSTLWMCRIDRASLLYAWASRRVASSLYPPLIIAHIAFF